MEIGVIEILIAEKKKNDLKKLQTLVSEADAVEFQL